MPEVGITAEQRGLILDWVYKKDPQGKPRGWSAGWEGTDRKRADRFAILEDGDMGNYLRIHEDRTRLPAWDFGHPGQNRQGVLSVSCPEEIAQQLEEAGLVQFPKANKDPKEQLEFG